MRKMLHLLVVCIMFSSYMHAQDDRFGQLTEKNIIGFTTPLVTALGMGINSANFYKADISETFGFSISFRAMLITVPDDQRSFSPELPAGYSSTEQTPTFFGKKGGQSYLGPGGYVTLPGGVDESSLPFAMPQISASFMGTEAMIRLVPTIKAGDEEISFFGFGIKHNVGQYIPESPVDVAVQFTYNKLKFTNIVEGTNFALNAHASKTFGLFIAYGGLQYESSTFDLNYTFKGDPNSSIPEYQQDRKISAEVKGDNNFRFILGGAVKLSVLVINADINLGSQTVFTSGLSFEF